MANASDENLTRQAQQGNQEAFLTLYNRYINRVYNRVKSRIPPADVEDVTQEIFIAVVRSIKSFKEQSTFSTWLYTIVNRQIADYYRRETRKKVPQNVENIDGLHTQPSYTHDNLAEKAMIQKALQEIPNHYQEVIMLRFADGLPFAQIAEKLDQNIEATKSLYRRAIQAVRDQINGE